MYPTKYSFDEHQGDFSCSSLPAGLEGNKEFERKFRKILGNLGKFEETWGNLRENNSE